MRTAICRGFFGNGGGVECMSSSRVDRCRARLLLSGTKVAFIGAKDRETTHLPRTGVFGYGTGWGCRLVGKLSGKKSSFVGNDFVWAVTRKRLLPICLENAFPVIHFSKFSGGRPVQWASRLTALAGGKHARASKSISPRTPISSRSLSLLVV